ncbi:protein rapunzel-like [Erpetoichthys calabaricus]|uniref:Protein rapunzel-like n=1 Tax=Erpetoichthys calabaricus TaxID=27687 RepID=A0A8C4SY23_ERPCA|nr:protein rapunzel-like [Erpetoichthys calabaricus]
MEDILEYKDDIKQGLIVFLNCVAEVSSAAAVFNPVFGIVGSFIKVVLDQTGNDEVSELKEEMDNIFTNLDQILVQTNETLNQVQKVSADLQYSRIERNIKDQFRMFQEIYDAKPEHKQQRTQYFEDNFPKRGEDQNLHTLYDLVMGKNLLFGQPILEVYKKYSNNDPNVMGTLCTRLRCLFSIGIIALVGYTVIIEDNEKRCIREWRKKMEDVENKMQMILNACQKRQ